MFCFVILVGIIYLFVFTNHLSEYGFEYTFEFIISPYKLFIGIYILFFLSILYIFSITHVIFFLTDSELITASYILNIKHHYLFQNIVNVDFYLSSYYSQFAGIRMVVNYKKNNSDKERTYIVQNLDSKDYMKLRKAFHEHKIKTFTWNEGALTQRVEL